MLNKLKQLLIIKLPFNFNRYEQESSKYIENLKNKDRYLVKSY